MALVAAGGMAWLAFGISNLVRIEAKSLNAPNSQRDIFDQVAAESTAAIREPAAGPERPILQVVKAPSVRGKRAPERVDWAAAAKQAPSPSQYQAISSISYRPV
jgi:hypothetical protein